MLQKLLRSRKFVTAVGALILSLGVIAWGWNEPVMAARIDAIVETVLILAGLYIGTTALEDAADKWRRGGPTLPS